MTEAVQQNVKRRIRYIRMLWQQKVQFLYTRTTLCDFVCPSSDNEQHETLGSLNDALNALSAQSLLPEPYLKVTYLVHTHNSYYS
jgi:hypothetical protein